jgi:preflagellin peptidase FlaK
MQLPRRYPDVLASTPDLLRLLAVPVLGWAAYRDVRTRRVPNRTWLPLGLLGVLLLAWELLAHLPPAALADRLFLFRVAVSLGFVAPLGYVFWRIGGFGGADAKALIVLAVLFPTAPLYALDSLRLPLVDTTLGVFSLTVLTNTVLLALAYPLALAARNLASGEVAPAMVVGRRVAVESLPRAHGRLLETTAGFTRGGLDLDALRMYLRWRGTTLAELRADPDAHRDPASVGETYEPTDGAVDAPATPRTLSSDGSGVTSDADDPWAAARFLEEIEGTAYGTDPETLREGLRLVTARDRVWISPGIPFIVPMFLGLVTALTYGDLLFALLGAVGLA